MKPEDLDDKTMQQILARHPLPEPDEQKKSANISESVQLFNKKYKKTAFSTQASDAVHRPMVVQTFKQLIGDFTMKHLTMKKAYLAGGTVACGIFAVSLMNSTMLSDGLRGTFTNVRDELSQPPLAALDSKQEEVVRKPDLSQQPTNSGAVMAEIGAQLAPSPAPSFTPPAMPEGKPAPAKEMVTNQMMAKRAMAPASVPAGAAGNRADAVGFVGGVSIAADMIAPQYHDEGRDKFKDIADSPIKQVSEEPVSTFSIDVDTASYSFVRRQINHGVLPQADAVRVEEMVNYFDYHYPAPESREAPFKSSVAVYPAPWNTKHQLVHIGIKGHEVQQAEKPHSNLVFLIDTSGSMSEADKLPLLINAFKLMVENLDENDTVSIATYAGSAGVVLEPTKASDKQKIIAALNNLYAGGSTAGAQGIKLAYDLARQHFDENAVNRVMLATDGDFNVGISNTEELKSYIEHERDSGIFLSVLGFGQGNYNDELMQALAQNGNGIATYIDTLSEARKVLVQEASATLYPIAKDVKIQIEFNPNRVSEYRLIGYQTRILNREDFNNDKVDAGDIGSGHTVTAIYEITPKGSESNSVDPLRYGTDKKAVEAKTNASDEIAFLKLRYKLPSERKSKLITTPITQANVQNSVNGASTDMRFAAAVAAFGEKLRGGKFLGDYGYDQIISLAQGAKGDDEFGYRAEFINLVRLAQNLPAM